MNIPFKIFARKTGWNIHIHPENHSETKLNIMFRDYLRNHPDITRRYDALKRELAANQENHYKTDIGFTEYTLGKNKLITEIIKLTGFDEYCLRFCAHHEEWDAYKKFTNDHDIDLDSAKYFIYYIGAEIIAAAKVQDDKIHLVAGSKTFLLKSLLKKWIASKNISFLLTDYFSIL